MAKKKIMYECMACGYESPKWLGKCPNCQGWNTMEEQVIETESATKPITNRQNSGSGAKQLHEITAQEEERILTSFQEFDRVLGGGVVPGSLVLIGGDPGIGKSTILLQVSFQLSHNGQKVLYVSGEESLSQIKMRASRLKIANSDMFLLSEVNLEEIKQQITMHEPDIIVIDSIQTMTLPEHTGAAGSVSQVREITAQLMRIAKDNQIAIFIVGHVTKEGNIAGPRMLEHMVDTVLYFEGEKYLRFRMLRAVKNRFGSTHELGVFEMAEEGLKEVINPSQLFLEERLPGATGSVVVPTLEGTRTIMAEIQSLMTPTVFGNAKRTSSGIEYQRVSLLLAVMEKHCGLLVQNQDAFFKTTGGVKLEEPAIDLAVGMSIASSYWNKPIAVEDCFVGEVGLTGEIRRVNQVKERVREAAKLGFQRIFIPANNMEEIEEDSKLEIIPLKTIQQALRVVFPR